jgi:hypothetical protein
MTSSLLVRWWRQRTSLVGILALQTHAKGMLILLVEVMVTS